MTTEMQIAVDIAVRYKEIRDNADLAAYYLNKVRTGMSDEKIITQTEFNSLLEADKVLDAAKRWCRPFNVVRIIDENVKTITE